MQVEAGGRANNKRETGNKAPGVLRTVFRRDKRAQN